MESKKKSRGAAGAERRVRRTNQDLAIEALSKRVNKLEAAFDTNTTIFSDALKVMEIKMNVFEQVLSMLHRDGAGLVQKEDRSVDFGYYLKRYLEELGAKEEKAAEPAAPPTPILASPNDDGPIIFGGD